MDGDVYVDANDLEVLTVIYISPSVDTKACAH